VQDGIDPVFETRAVLNGEAAPDEDHLARLRGASGAEADVHGRDPRDGPLAWDHGRRVRAPAIARDSRGAQPPARPASGAGRGGQADGPGSQTERLPVILAEDVAAFGSRLTISEWGPLSRIPRIRPLSATSGASPSRLSSSLGT